MVIPRVKDDMKILPLALLAGLNAAYAGEATFHRWVDQEGRIHFSDQPPPTAAAEIVVVDVADPAPGNRGLRPGEKRWLSELRREERLERAARDARVATRLSRESERDKLCREIALALSKRPSRSERVSLLRRDRRLCGAR